MFAQCMRLIGAASLRTNENCNGYAMKMGFKRDVERPVKRALREILPWSRRETDAYRIYRGGNGFTLQLFEFNLLRDLARALLNTASSF